MDFREWRYVIFILFLFQYNFGQVNGQTYLIKGKVIDRESEEGIPFASVYFTGTTIGVDADIDGNYELKVSSLKDTLIASALGYNPIQKLVSADTFQRINFLLSPSDFTLAEVVVNAGENPANEIVRNIVKHKKKNNFNNLPAYGYEAYTKVELDLDNISEKLRGNRLLKPFNFIFESIDSTSDEEPFLPIYLSEDISKVYRVKEEGRSKSFRQAQRTSGTPNTTAIDLIKDIHDEFSIYDDWILILEKPFISPFAQGGLSYYEYYIIDSTLFNGKWSYKIKFKPKRKKELTFFGDFWVADTSFAIQRVNMRMSNDVNINFVDRIVIYQEFIPDGDLWLPVKDKMIVNFFATKKAPGIISRQTQTFQDFQFDLEIVQEHYNQKEPRFYRLDDLKKEDVFWENSRHEPLSDTEEGIYGLIDSIQNVPLYKTYTETLEALFTGYIEVGKFELGPYFSIYSNNIVEGSRLRLGARTNSKFSKQMEFGAYLAYGFKDQEYKYGLDAKWLLQKYPRTLIGGAIRNDISLSSENSEDFLEGDLLSGSFRRNILQKLIRVEETKVFYERDWQNDFSNKLIILNRNLDPYGGPIKNGGGFNYAYTPGTDDITNIDTTISTTEFIFKTRFAHEEEIVDNGLDRTSFGSRFPILEFQYTLGINGLFGGDYSYHKFGLSYRHYFYMNPLGWFSYRLYGGKIIGKTPFLLMHVHPGSESLFMSRSVFNTMNRYEFASDTYASIFLEHHFDGFFFNKVPLLRKLGFRTVASFKAISGSITDENKEANQLNLFQPIDDGTYNGFRAPSDGLFMEAGVGIENILKVLRVDALWRLSYLDNPEASRFAFVGGFYLFF